MRDPGSNGPGTPGGTNPVEGASGQGLILPADAERRLHPRFAVGGANLLLYPAGFLSFLVGRENAGRSVLDLSLGGARLLTLDRLSPGTRVRLRIQLEKFEDVIQAAGSVRWCFASAKDEADFFAGIQFEGLDAAQCRQIEAMRRWFTSPQHKLRQTTRRFTRS